MPAQDDQPENMETSGTVRGVRIAPLDAAQSDVSHGPIPGAVHRSSTQAEGRTDPTPEPRNADSSVGVATKGSEFSSERLPTSDRSEDAPVGHADTESFWGASAPLPAAWEAQSAAPAQSAIGPRPATAEPAETAAQPVSRDVSLHLADGESSVDIRMAERAGEIRVTVHTPDRDLADSLRADLPDLVGKLRQSGFQAEAWRPAAATEPDTGRRSGSHGSPSQEHSPGGRKEGRQQQPQPEPSKKQSAWAGA